MSRKRLVNDSLGFVKFLVNDSEKLFMFTGQRSASLNENSRIGTIYRNIEIRIYRKGNYFTSCPWMV